MDHFLEEVVVKRKRMLDDALHVLSLPLMVLLALFAVLNISTVINYATTRVSLVSLLPSLLVGLVAAGLAVLLFFP